MIKKPLTKPLKIPFCEALKDRLDISHIKYPQILSDLGTYYSGYYGEKSLIYYLSTLSEQDYYIFHGLRLENETYPFQMDVLILSKKLPYIIEAKNHSGELFLDTPLNQLIQTKASSRDVYPCPILQSERQQFELQNWLTTHNFLDFPVDKIVVFTHKKALIQTHPDHKDTYRKICKSPDLKNRLEKAENKLSKELSPKHFKKLVKLLLKKHVPIWSCQLLEEYKIRPEDVKPGVECPNCQRIGMVYHKGTWNCPICHTRSKTAYEKAIRDYFILIKPTITNSELRAFLQITSPRVANRILLLLNLSFSGEKKARVYHAPKEYPYYQ